VRGLRDLVDERGQEPEELDIRPLPSRRHLRTEQAMLPRDAFFARAEDVKPRDAEGRVSAELVTPYPPGIPAVAPVKSTTRRRSTTSRRPSPPERLSKARPIGRSALCASSPCDRGRYPREQSG
jgi:hypothetical protein